MVDATELNAQDAQTTKPGSAAPPLEELVLESIARSCNLNRSIVTLDADAAGLGADSLVLTSLMVELEATYGIELSTEQKVAVYEAYTIRDVIEAVAPSLA